MINKDIISGKWKEIAGEVQKKFGELTENDLEKVKGNFTALVGLLEQKVGMTKEDAHKKAMELIEKVNQNPLKSKAEETAGKVLETANTFLDAVKEKLKKDK